MSNLSNKEIMAKNIKRYMDKKAINRRKLSEDLRLSYTTISSWLQADSYPRIDKIEAMAKYFGVDKADLVEDHENKNVSNDDLNTMLDNARSFDGKPMTETDRKLIKQYLEALYGNR